MWADKVADGFRPGPLRQIGPSSRRTAGPRRAPEEPGGVRRRTVPGPGEATGTRHTSSPSSACGSVLARGRYHALDLGMDGEQLTHGRLGPRSVARAERVDDPRVMRQGGVVRPLTA